MSEILTEYLDQQVALGEYTPKTAREKGRWLRRFVAVCGDRPLDTYERGDVIAFLSDASELRASTRRLGYDSVRSFFNWACIEQRTTVNPTLSVKPPKIPKGTPRCLTRKQVDEVRAQCRVSGKERGTLIFWLMYAQGMRCEEVALLRHEDIDREASKVHIRGKGYAGERSRCIPLAPQTLEALDRYLARCEHTTGLVVRGKTGRGNGLSGKGVSDLMASWMANSGIKGGAFDGISAHALRHTAAEEMAETTDDIRVVQTFLGHANLATTQTYLRRGVTGVDDAMAARFGGVS